ncbi:hypothetical protein OHA18_04790 [Kribbella sp. NBC_00709]|uniref:hypothetical protein n=1 Tax=Kribbella sp. NBC_00709 TaxID=2975972 RepID=UPI002E2C3B68|nr:hypothetical protein [Kribbella sp. NBC_00709]
MKRRTVLQGSVAGAVAAATSVAGGNQARAATPAGVGARTGVTPTGPDAVRVVNGPAGQTVRVPAELGVELTVGPGGGRSRVALTYDERLYTAVPRPVLVLGRQVIPLDARSMATGPAHGRMVEIRLPELAPGRYTLHAGGMTPARFPLDLIADPLPTEVTVSEATGALTAQVLSERASAQGLPWGVQLGAAWQQARWGDDYYAWYPSLVTLHSVGPGVVPPGSRVRLTVDQRIFEAAQITSASGSNGERIGGVARRATVADRLTATWTLHAAVASGSRITLTCVPGLRAPLGPLEYAEPPLVEFLPPRQSKAPQRLTGEETQTRADDVYSSATRALFAPA